MTVKKKRACQSGVYTKKTPGAPVVDMLFDHLEPGQTGLIQSETIQNSQKALCIRIAFRALMLQTRHSTKHAHLFLLRSGSIFQPWCGVRLAMPFSGWGLNSNIISHFPSERSCQTSWCSDGGTDLGVSFVNPESQRAGWISAVLGRTQSNE